MPAPTSPLAPTIAQTPTLAPRRQLLQQLAAAACTLAAPGLALADTGRPNPSSRSSDAVSNLAQQPGRPDLGTVPAPMRKSPPPDANFPHYGLIPDLADYKFVLFSHFDYYVRGGNEQTWRQGLRDAGLPELLDEDLAVQRMLATPQGQQIKSLRDVEGMARYARQVERFLIVNVVQDAHIVGMRVTIFDPARGVIPFQINLRRTTVLLSFDMEYVQPTLKKIRDWADACRAERPA